MTILDDLIRITVYGDTSGSSSKVWIGKIRRLLIGAAVGRRGNKKKEMDNWIIGIFRLTDERNGNDCEEIQNCG